MVVSIIIAAFCGANLIYDENNYVFVSYFTYGSMHFLQISAHLKSDTFTFMHLADAFIQSNLQCIQAIHFFVSMCSLGIEPTTFALLTQCSNH